jgi:hypothetical protein
MLRSKSERCVRQKLSDDKRGPAFPLFAANSAAVKDNSTSSLDFEVPGWLDDRLEKSNVPIRRMSWIRVGC